MGKELQKLFLAKTIHDFCNVISKKSDYRSEKFAEILSDVILEELVGKNIKL